MGICLQGVGVVAILTHVLQLFRLHPRVGSVYVGLRLCISEVFGFAVTYGVITVAFALGLHSILRHSRELCDAGGNPVELTCNGTFGLRSRTVGVYCTFPDGTRTVCKDECWETYVSEARVLSQPTEGGEKRILVFSKVFYLSAPQKTPQMGHFARYCSAKS